jgi:hypothetical protein
LRPDVLLLATLTVQAVWACVVLSTIVILVVPWTAAKFSVLSHDQSLTQVAMTPAGKPAGVYFATVVHEKADDLSSPLVGSGRFNLECWLMNKVGLDVAALSPSQRMTAQFFFDGLFPFVVLMLVSWFTPRTERNRVEQFYGR